MSAQVTVSGVRANIHAARYFPGVKTADSLLFMGEGSGPRVRARVEVDMTATVGGSFAHDLKVGGIYRVELADHDGWCGHAIEARSMRFCGASGPSPYSGRVTLTWVSDGPPVPKK